MHHTAFSIHLSNLLFLATILIGSFYVAGGGGYTPNEIRAAIGAPAIAGGNELNFFGHAWNAFYAEIAE